MEIENPANTNILDYAAMKFQTKVLTMLAKVKERNPNESNKKATLITLKEARENQSRLVKKAQLESHRLLLIFNKIFHKHILMFINHFNFCSRFRR